MAQRPAYPQGSPSFDVGAVIVLGIFAAGGYVDGWAHNHFGSTIESFFTVWHAILYGGFGISALYVVVPAIRNRGAGYDWAHCLPRGYGTMLLGVVLFAVFGFFDMLWHIMFGFETSIDAFMSPPHVALFFSSLLMYCGPIRAMLLRNDPDRTSWRRNAAFVLALLWIFGSLTFLMQPWLLISVGDASASFAPTGSAWSSSVKDLETRGDLGMADVGGLHADAAGARAKNAIEQPTKLEILFERAGTANVLIYAVLLAGFLLFAIKSGRIPPGTFTLIFFVDTLGMSLMKELTLAPGFMLVQIALGLLWGIVTDAFYALLRPTIAASSALYAFMFLAPACTFALYFIGLALYGGGLWWVLALPTGSALYAGGIGVLLALVASRWEPA